MIRKEVPGGGRDGPGRCQGRAAWRRDVKARWRKRQPPILHTGRRRHATSPCPIRPACRQAGARIAGADGPGLSPLIFPCLTTRKPARFSLTRHSAGSSVPLKVGLRVGSVLRWAVAAVTSSLWFTVAGRAEFPPSGGAARRPSRTDLRARGTRRSPSLCRSAPFQGSGSCARFHPRWWRGGRRDNCSEEEGAYPLPQRARRARRNQTLGLSAAVCFLR